MADRADPWKAWLDQHGPALVLLARQWTRDRADAEDIVQEAFVRFWRSRTDVHDPAAWLYACVKRCAWDQQRRRQRRFRRESAAARNESEPLFACPLEQDERRSAIEDALTSLPAEQAEVLVMKVWGSLTFPQIAQALEISANTAASRYRYALEKLREALSEEPIR